MDRKQTSSSLDANETSAQTTAAERRASLLRRPRQSSQDPSNQSRSYSVRSGQESTRSFDARGKSISQTSVYSQEYVMGPDAIRSNHDADYGSDHDSDVDSEGRPRSRRPSNVEEDVCYPFHSTYKEKDISEIASDINLIALHNYLTNYDPMQSGLDSDLPRPKSGIDFRAEDPESRFGQNDGYSVFGDEKEARSKQPLPRRFVFYSVATGTVRSDSLAGLQHEGSNLEALLLAGNYWIDITSPTDNEMKTISKVFGIHPLTTEDILTEESREKCEIFPNYMFVCYRAFNQDHYSPDFLEPVNYYNVVFKHGLISFHFEPSSHSHNVRKRARHLQSFMNVTSDWINYAIIDDISDSFGPLIKQIEVEVDSIDDLVLLLRESEQSDMLRRIGSCRKMVMHLLRLLTSKSDVIRGLIKRSEDRTREYNSRFYDAGNPLINLGGLAGTHRSGTATPTQIASNVAVPREGAFKFMSTTSPDLGHHEEEDKLYNPDVTMYFGDIQDHIVTMLQNLNHYETILSRAHSNYLAQISIELTQTSNSFNQTVSRLTVFATVLVPMNIITGLFGMNVRVPGEAFQDLGYFFWIVASLAMFAVFSLALAKRADLM
ncbi:hypothetical protein INT44_007262 [Umbelopsis vinacea]|uniref:Uncharacterized protein n=1 Tax=Umbelopsis vinacea TaxID=44442 RepID=A0A8H7PMA6_9FUNG|nr:hypothetical protein INT44_007262 [Umbelopsis vinacea]